MIALLYYYGDEYVCDISRFQDSHNITIFFLPWDLTVIGGYVAYLAMVSRNIKRWSMCYSTWISIII